MITTRINCFCQAINNSEEDIAFAKKKHFKTKRIVKRITSAILCATTLFTMVACTPAKSPDGTATPESTEKVEQTPTVKLPEYENETVQLKDIGEYTIVYPSEYTDYRKQDVEYLQKVIKNTTGASLKVVSDAEEAQGKEIIIASSKRKNGVEEAIEKFQSGLDYVVAVRNGNIVLGGNNFYADMRAIYDFINNTLGYNDIDDKQGEIKTELSGVNYNIYEKPPIQILACNYSVSQYTEQSVMRDMADAHFNMINVNRYSNENLLNLMKWCARYEIFICLEGEDESRLDMMYDCPVIYSTLVIDEPLTERIIAANCVEYMRKYEKYGWKPFINFIPVTSAGDMLIEWEGVLDGVPMMSFDIYPGHSLYWTYRWDMDLLGCYERYSHIARTYNKELWVYIESYNVTNREQNTSKMFRWQGYMALSFGAKNILYFQYGDASPNYTAEGDWSFGSLINWDYTKNDSWFDAQRFNEELLALAQIYNNYEQKGACTLNASIESEWLNYSSPYPYAKDIVPEYICEDTSNDDAYLLGFFDKKDNDSAHAFTIVNISDLNSEPYESDEAKYVKFKITGENVTFYRNGKTESVEKTDDGYYRVNMANGYCWFVTVD